MNQLSDIHKHRLQLISKFLRGLFEKDPKRFSFFQWVGDDWLEKPDLSCGTSACAIGWATTIPELREAGLRLLKTSPVNAVPCLVHHVELFQIEREEYGGWQPGWEETLEALYEVLGLNEHQVCVLFIPGHGSTRAVANHLSDHATAREVADNIDRFLDYGGDIRELHHRGFVSFNTTEAEQTYA